MRLLKISRPLTNSKFTESMVTVEFVKVSDRDIKKYPYAILSHRWNDVEVLFQDVDTTTNSHLSMPAWTKIQRFCEKAFKNGLYYAWADTCCINKSESVELSRELNSMFRYYDQSAVCYTYMADVMGAPDPQDFESEFCRSAWFTRGWTLQELLASSKASLAPLIRHVTNIQNLHDWRDCCIAEKISKWGDRETEEIEDIAYSLLDIFDVSLVPIDGEGEKAFQRLQLAIIEKSNDESLFAWRDDNSMMETGQSLLAISPLQFKDSGNVRPAPYTDKENKLIRKAPRDKRQRRPYEMTQNGMRIEAPWLEKKIGPKDPIKKIYKQGIVMIPIRCTTNNSLDKNWTGIVARCIDGSNYKKLGIRLLERDEQKLFMSSHTPFWSKTLYGALINYKADFGVFARTSGFMGGTAMNGAPWLRFYFQQNDDTASAEVYIPKYEHKGMGSLTDAKAE